MIDPRFEYIRHQILLDYRGAMMTQDAKAIKSLDNTFNSGIDDWVKEAMWDFKLDDKVFDKETVKKILRFGYYTAVYTFIEQEVDK